MPAAIYWELDLLTQEVMKNFVELVKARGLARGLNLRPKEHHLKQMRESGHFRYTYEALLHHVEQGDATRYLEMMRSSAFNNQFQFTEQESGLDHLTQAALQYIGSEPVPWYVSYRVRIGVK